MGQPEPLADQSLELECRPGKSHQARQPLVVHHGCTDSYMVYLSADNPAILQLYNVGNWPLHLLNNSGQPRGPSTKVLGIHPSAHRELSGSCMHGHHAPASADPDGSVPSCQCLVQQIHTCPQLMTKH